MANQNINLLQHHNCNIACYQSANCRMNLMNNEVGRGEQALRIIQTTTLFDDTDRDAEQLRLFCNENVCENDKKVYVRKMLENV